MASHTLRPRAVIDDMRQAYGSERSWISASDQSERVSNRQSHSEGDRSYRTQPTTCSPSPGKEHKEVQRNSYADRAEQTALRFWDDREPQASPSTSVETYASTIASQEEEELVEDLPESQVPEYLARPYETAVFAATPADFSELFPSHRKLLIRHDDTTLDGNLNLRLDTDVTIRGQHRLMTLFHLRMHDLKKREFSLRRYCRDSGREVCHSVRKHQEPAVEKRPGVQRSLSHVLNSMRSKSESKTPTASNLMRNDSGYGSMHSIDFTQDRPDSSHASRVQQHKTHTIKLEFSNYAQVDVKRVGVKAGKRYEFEYWGVSYAWRRTIRREENARKISFQLKKAGSEQILANIVPASMSTMQADEECAKGGWITPCSLWISDEKIVRGQKDLADVIISAGIIALVDNSIRERFHKHQTSNTRVEYVGPKRLLSEMFRRGSTASSNHSRPASSSGRPSTSSGPAQICRPPAAMARHMSHEC